MSALAWPLVEADATVAQLVSKIDDVVRSISRFALSSEPWPKLQNAALRDALVNAAEAAILRQLVRSRRVG